jgi:hypothetical protein
MLLGVHYAMPLLFLLETLLDVENHAVTTLLLF